MALSRIAVVVLVSGLSLGAAGCFGFGGSSGEGTASTAPFGRRDAKAPAGDGEADFARYSPEASMQRDLLALREREAKQLEMVESLRAALDQGQDDVRREEERLREIRSQIDRYDTAMRRYEMAARYAAPRQGMAEYPRGDHRDVGPDYAAARPVRRDYGDFGRSIPERGNTDYGPNPAPAAAGRSASYPAAQREEVLYAGGPDPRAVAATRQQSAPARAEVYAADPFAVPGDLPPARQYQAAQTFGQTHGQPARFDEPAQGMLFADAVPARQTPWPPSTPAAPAPRPAPAAEPSRPAPAKIMHPMDAGVGGMEDEVFTPDLFLSSR